MPDLTVGVASAISPLVRRILAPNPGLMTEPGTNTYLVGVDEIAVVDPGPDEPSHLDAIVGCGGDRLRWVLPTHPHPAPPPRVGGPQARAGGGGLRFATRDGVAPR